jgi:cyclic beta-1,2-glucan synthetase
VLAASRQFEEGDVQHWWLPSSGFGVRTRIVDNRVWLPFVTTHYMRVTGDRGVLDENIGFLGGAPLRPDQHEEVTIPPPSGQSASLFEHCARALDVSLGIGEHGLPLFGTGDWNDGMNRVGMEGRGESVWMAWFLYATLMAFAPVAEARGETARAQRWRDHAYRLQQAVEREAWDGDWYRRGYFDDGSPLGSISSDECRIDSIAQSWGVISGAADRERSQRAMAAVDGQLVSRADALIRLFTPAFDHSSHDPGYVKGYPAGLRENGGQYTHGAIWSVLAFARLGDGDRAGELFSLINPIHHASSRAGIYRYKVEPYVACADIYTAPGHVGRGGWTWYTGSAGWMYRAALEGLLGLNVEADTMRLAPCIPRAWRGFEIDYVHRGTLHSIRVDNPQGVSHGLSKVLVDGVVRNVAADGAVLPLFDDGATHRIEITLG